jgi:hypothetical protein
MPIHSPRQPPGPDPLDSSDPESSLSDTPTPCVIVRDFCQPTTPQVSAANGSLGARAFRRRPDRSCRGFRAHHSHQHNVQPITPLRLTRDARSVLLRARPERYGQNRGVRTQPLKREGAQAPLLLNTDPNNTPATAQDSGESPFFIQHLPLGL